MLASLTCITTAAAVLQFACLLQRPCKDTIRSRTRLICYCERALPTRLQTRPLPSVTATVAVTVTVSVTVAGSVSAVVGTGVAAVGLFDPMCCTQGCCFSGQHQHPHLVPCYILRRRYSLRDTSSHMQPACIQYNENSQHVHTKHRHPHLVT